MECDEPILTVGACAHLLGAAHEDPHGAGPNLGEQGLFANIRVGVMDERDLILRDSLFHEFLFQVIIYIKAAIFFGGGQVAENELGAALFSCLLPYLEHVPGASGHFAVGIIRGEGLHQPHIQRQLSAIIGHFEHIVVRRINMTGTNLLGPFCQTCDHLLLEFGRSDDLGVEVGLLSVNSRGDFGAFVAL